eukprot:scaffold53243_cov19-Tisochrysis_lutea.AAC.3
MLPHLDAAACPARAWTPPSAWHAADVLGEGGREHHDLLVVWGHLEDFLYISAHVCTAAGKMGGSSETRFWTARLEDNFSGCMLT